MASFMIDREARLDGVALDPAERVALYTGGLGQLLLRHYLRFALCLYRSCRFERRLTCQLPVAHFLLICLTSAYSLLICLQNSTQTYQKLVQCLASSVYWYPYTNGGVFDGNLVGYGSLGLPDTAGLAPGSTGRGKSMLKKIVTLGVIVALVAAMTANIAGAQPGKGKALGHKTATNTDGATPQDELENSKKVLVCHKPPGNEENAHVISISENAWPAHKAHGDELIDETTQGECGSEAACDISGDAVTVTDAGTTGVVDAGDVLSISGDFEEPEPDARITVKDSDSAFTFVNGTDADITVDDSGLSIEVTTIEPTGLTTTGLEGVSSEGITCTDDPSQTVTGQVAETKDGAPVLKTSSGNTLKLALPKKTQKQEERLLKSLKGQQIEVKGELKSDKGGKGKNKTIKATAIKKVKAKGKK